MSPVTKDISLRCLFWGLVALAATRALGGVVLAHPVSQSYWFVELRETSIQSRLILSREDLPEGSPSREDGRELEGWQTDPLEEPLEELFARHFRFLSGMEQLPAAVSEVRIETSGTVQWTSEYRFSDVLPDRITLEGSLGKALRHPHQTFCRVQGAGPTLEFVLTPENPSREVPLRDPLPSRLAGLFSALVRGTAIFLGSAGLLLAFGAVVLSAPRSPGLWINAGFFAVGFGAGLPVGCRGWIDFPGSLLNVAVPLAAVFLGLEILLGSSLRALSGMSAVAGFLCGLVFHLQLELSAGPDFSGSGVVDCEWLPLAGALLGQLFLVVVVKRFESRFRILTRLRLRVAVVVILVGLLLAGLSSLL